LATLTTRDNAQLRTFPADLVSAARATASEVLGELAGKSDKARKVHDSYMAFRDKISAWSRISIQAVLEARAG
jgi:TRAP-type mannitol/chloroaromatic compound transport system substrate-binding protein